LTYRLVKGCGENLFHHIAREGNVMTCRKILDIAKNKELNISTFLLRCDISGFSPLSLAIVNSYYEIADMMLDHISEIRPYRVDSKKKSFNKKFVVSEQHPLRIALDFYAYTLDAGQQSHIISKIFSKIDKQTHEIGDLFKRIIQTKNDDLFRLTFTSFSSVLNYRLTISWIIEENGVEMLSTFFDILREKQKLKTQSHLVRIPLTEFDFVDMLLSMLQKLELLTVFLDNYDFQDYFARDALSKTTAISSTSDMKCLVSKIIGSHYALDGKPLAPILREFASRGFLRPKGDAVTPKCSNYLLLQFLVYTKRMHAGSLRAEAIKDRIECLWMLLNSGLGWLCNKKHQHEVFGIKFSAEYPKGDAIGYAKSFDYGIFYGHFYPVLLEHRKNISLFRLLYNEHVN
jgi:hypothetical protein